MGGQGRFTGGYLLTDADNNHTVFNEGITTKDINNHLTIKGDAISAGVSLSQQGLSPTGIGYGTLPKTDQTSITQSAVTGQAGQANITAQDKERLNEVLTNSFDESVMGRQLGLQVEISREFDRERSKIRSDYAQRADKLRQEADKESDPNKASALHQRAQKIEQNLRLFDGITSAIYTPNAGGMTGDIARFISPEAAYQIGQYFKENGTEGEGSHLLAHALLGAATSYATGNDIALGAASSVTGESVAPVLAKVLYNNDNPSTLTQEQKDTLSSIIRIGTTTAAVAATGEVSTAVNAGEVGKVGVENNALENVLMPHEFEAIKDPNYVREQLEAIKNIPNAVVELHQHYNDMTIINFSVGIVSYSAIMNNKNGNVWITGVQEVRIDDQQIYKPIAEISINANIQEMARAVQASSRSPNRISRPVGFGMSVNFGSIQGGSMKPNDIDEAIKGSSVGIQACHGVCGGVIKTSGGKTILTYGAGSSQIGVTGGNMVQLSEEKKQQLLKILGASQ